LSQLTRLTDGQTDRQTDRQTDGQTDGQTEFSSLDRVCIPYSAVKIQVDVFFSERSVELWLSAI